MEKPWDEPMLKEEIEEAKKLEDIQVVFDVGARTSLDYLELWPNAEYHLFEPYPPFFQWLQEATKNMPNVHVNGFGLGDIEGEIGYNTTLQSFMNNEGDKLPIKTLNRYIKDHNITRIDLLKIDTEKWDYKVLQGGTKAIGMARYIQYETWNKPENDVMIDMLEDKYDIRDIGKRNMLCTLK